MARQSCGGHGYGLYSGLPQLYNNSLRTQTVEGDNNVLCLQVSRFLMKAWDDLQTGKVANLSGNVRYLSEAMQQPTQPCQVSSQEDWLRPEVQLHAFGHWATRAVRTATGKIRRDVENGLVQHEAENRRMQELVEMARTHGYYSILNCFTNALDALAASVSSELRAVLARLRDLFALETLRQNLGGVAGDGYVSEAQAEMLGDVVQSLLEALRPDAVALVDAFAFDDTLELHQTALGAYDGDVYQRLWDWSEKDPANNALQGRASGTLPPNFFEKWRPLLEYYRVADAQHVAGQVRTVGSSSKL